MQDVSYNMTNLLAIEMMDDTDGAASKKVDSPSSKVDSPSSKVDLGVALHENVNVTVPDAGGNPTLPAEPVDNTGHDNGKSESKLETSTEIDVTTKL